MTRDLRTARSWVEVDLGALRHNLGVAKRYAGPNGGVMAVVKADAYGLGARLIVPELERAGADCFAVATLAEGQDLQALGVARPIYLLSSAAPAERAAVVAAGGRFIPAVSSFEEASDYSALAAAAAITQPVHLVVDTGMGRIGLLESEAVEVAARISALPGLTIDSVASHFPSADVDVEFTKSQLGRYHALLGAMARAGVAGPRHHIANSAGTLNQPRLGHELVRTGLILLGVSPLSEQQGELRNVATWKARVVLVRTLPAGHGVSYGRTFITSQSTRVATIPVGYADGYPRQASGQGAWIWLGDQRCPMLGRVTMDQIMVGVPQGVEPGDVATLMGGQGPGAIEVAGYADTIAYDVFCGLGGRVERLAV